MMYVVTLTNCEVLGDGKWYESVPEDYADIEYIRYVGWWGHEIHKANKYTLVEAKRRHTDLTCMLASDDRCGRCRWTTQYPKASIQIEDEYGRSPYEPRQALIDFQPVED